MLDTYLTSDTMKTFIGLAVTESSPVSLYSPYSAFNIPLLESGTIFDGKWGFVKGGIGNVTKELAQINKRRGVSIITSAKVNHVSKDGEVTYEKKGTMKSIAADHVIFATDPLTASLLTDNEQLIRTVSKKKFLGTSGKLIMFFKKPVQWKDSDYKKDFESACRFIFISNTPDQFEMSTRDTKRKEFSPCYFEIYCEGAGRRKMGEKMTYDVIDIFFKNLALSRKGKELEHVRKEVEELILSKIKNKGDLITSILLTPKDLQEIFFFPEGNIDHLEVCEGQTFFQRNYSPNPKKNFYQFGNSKRMYYCGAGAYPCGSVAGTPGYMCAKYLIKNQGGIKNK